MTTEVETPVAPAKKRSAKPVNKATAKKKGVKGAKKAMPAAKGTKPSGRKEPTVRERALKALLKKDMTASEVQEAIGLGHGLKPTLDQEVERGHLKPVPNKEDGTAQAYTLTAAGKKALQAGNVNPKRGE